MLHQEPLQIDKFVYVTKQNLVLILMMIGISFLGGTILGGIAIILIIKDNTRELTKELDKFRELYFAELDQWKNKYDDDGYNAD